MRLVASTWLTRMSPPAQAVWKIDQQFNLARWRVARGKPPRRDE